MKRPAEYVAVCMVLAAALLSQGCRQQGDACSEDTPVKCECPDGNFGTFECIDGVLGKDCVCLPPENAEPCAYLIESSEADNATFASGRCAGDAYVYVECSAEMFYVNDTLTRGLRCKKVDGSGAALSPDYIYTSFTAGDLLERGCKLLNDICCESDAVECLK